MSQGAEGDVLLERDGELAVIAGAQPGTGATHGSAILLSGPTGIGKTALLDRALRGDAGTCLAARGIEIERAFAFGSVLRLLQALAPREEPVAAPVRALLVDGRPPATDDEETVVRGVVHLVATRAAAAPITVVVDDLQACDDASLRTLVALVRARPPGLRVLLALRTGDGPLPAALGAFRDVPGLRHLPLRPLTADAVARLGAGDRAEALRRHTGGNPLFVRELLREPGGGLEHAPPMLVRMMERRLERLSPTAREIAGALAVLNGHADAQLLGRTVGLDADDLASGLTELARRGVADSTGFRHPVDREAALGALAWSVRAGLHIRAAHALHRENPRAAAAHLVGADGYEGAREPWAIQTLLRAAELAGEGSAERRQVLQQVLAGPLNPDDEASARAALGLSLVQHHDPAGVDELARAQQLAVGRAAAEIAIQRAEALFHLTRMDEAAGVCREALRDLDDRDDATGGTRLRLEAAALAAEAARGNGPRPVVAAQLLDGPLSTPGERAVLSRLAWHLATSGTVPADEVRRLAFRAMGGHALLDEVGVSSPAFVYAASALVIAGDPEAVVGLATEAARRARDADAPVGVTYALALRGQAHVARGALLDAAADAQTALDGLDAANLPAQAVAMAWRLETAIDLGDRAEAMAELQASGLADDLPDLGPVHLLLLARAGLLASEGADDEALADLLLLRERAGARYPNPSGLCWPPRLAVALAAAGALEDAYTTIDRATERADAFGVPRALGQCLHAQGRIRGRDGAEVLRQAAAVLDGAGLRLELARVLLDLGELRHAAGDPEGRALLRQGLQEAHAAGATAVVDDAMRRLRAAGARPRRPRVPGTHMLRPQRRLVIELAAEGLEDAAIAERLFLRSQTVAEHVREGLQTLGLDDRAALLAADPAVRRR